MITEYLFFVKHAGSLKEKCPIGEVISDILALFLT